MINVKLHDGCTSWTLPDRTRFCESRWISWSRENPRLQLKVCVFSSLWMRVIWIFALSSKYYNYSICFYGDEYRTKCSLVWSLVFLFCFLEPCNFHFRSFDLTQRVSNSSPHKRIHRSWKRLTSDHNSPKNEEEWSYRSVADTWRQQQTPINFTKVFSGFTLNTSFTPLSLFPFMSLPLSLMRKVKWGGGDKESKK